MNTTIHRLAVAAMGALALGPGINPAFASEHDTGPALGATTVFATAPAPGHLFGVAVDRGRIYVSTSAGDFFADPANGGHPNSDGERIFVYDMTGNLVSTTSIATMPNATMGLFGLAFDGNPTSTHQLYIADMNGRILRMNAGRDAGTPQLFAQTPPPLSAGGWVASMWNDLTFDSSGNLLMTDDKPRLWRVTPDGTPSIWFEDPRIAGYFGFAGGPLGGRIDPTGHWFYFTITISDRLESVVYRLRLVEHPTAADLELVHRFPAVQGQPLPQATGLAFAQSGNMYVSLIGPNQIAVLDPAGNEIRRISSPLFDSPWGLAFVGQSLLVTNADIQPVESPNKWTVLKVYVGENGLALNRPKLP
jgi:hypothetical protein